MDNYFSLINIYLLRISGEFVGYCFPISGYPRPDARRTGRYPCC